MVDGLSFFAKVCTLVQDPFKINLGAIHVVHLYVRAIKFYDYGSGIVRNFKEGPADINFKCIC